MEQGIADGAWNRAVAYVSLALGAALGLVLGLWSFEGPLPPPSWLGEYADTPRRLVRLGHIAFFGLGILNLLVARDLPRLRLPQRQKRAVRTLMNFGNLILPANLLAAGVFPPVKFLLPLPAVSVFSALLLVAVGAWRDVAASVPAGELLPGERVP
ncbi:MAG: hypothetical protein ACE5Q3_17685 [Alphaproteobacteria bacterium]